MQHVHKARTTIALAVGAGLLALAGCTSTSPGTAAGATGAAQGPDVSAAGQVDYACALVTDVGAQHDSVDSWFTGIGDKADPATHQVAGAVGLLGAVVGAHLEGFTDLSEGATTILTGISTIDTERMQDGLDMVIAGCQEHELPAKQPDISPDGQIDYACALAADATKSGPVRDWFTGVGDDVDPAIHELAGAAGLSGAMTASELAGHQPLSDAGTDIFQGITILDPEQVQQGLDAMVDSCAQG